MDACSTMDALCFLRLRPLLHWLFRSSEVESAVDQRQMGERLREIADQPSRLRIVFFAQQADIIAQLEQAIEQRPRIMQSALQHIGINQPEAASQESPLARCKAVLGFLGVVAHHESVYQQVPLDRIDCAADPRVIGGQKAGAWQQQKARIKLFAPIALHEAPKLMVEAAAANIGMNFRRPCPPAIDRSSKVEFFGALDGTVERKPSHDLGIGEVPRAAAQLPDSLVCLHPDVLKVLEERDLQRPTGFASRKSMTSGLMQRIHHFAKNVELALAMRSIANSNREGAFVAWKPGGLPFAQPPLT